MIQGTMLQLVLPSDFTPEQRLYCASVQTILSCSGKARSTFKIRKARHHAKRIVTYYCSSPDARETLHRDLPRLPWDIIERPETPRLITPAPLE